MNGLHQKTQRAVRYSRLVGERGLTEIDDTSQGLKVRFSAKRGNPAVVPVAAVFVDIVSVALILWMATGLYMWWHVPKTRLWGWLALGGGAVCFAVIMFSL